MFDLLENQQFLCGLSGFWMDPEDATVDHVIPLESGGPHDVSNVMFVHDAINTMKGTMTLRRFLNACLMVATHAGLAEPTEDGKKIIDAVEKRNQEKLEDFLAWEREDWVKHFFEFEPVEDEDSQTKFEFTEDEE